MRQRRTKAFTLIEVLVVVAIIAVLAAILMPSLAKAREQAVRAQCAGNFMNVGRAFHMYANDHRDYLPASWSGGFWSFVLDFNKAYFDKRKLGGDIFMCPTWKQPVDANGKPRGWDTLVSITGSDGKAVATGYDFWTFIVADPYFTDGSGNVGVRLIPIREFTRTFNRPPSWAEALVDQGYIVPWMNKTTDRGGPVRDLTQPGKYVYYTRRVAPSDQRMAWDQVQASQQTYGGEGFHPDLTRHYRDGATGANVLYGDGHIKWRRFSEMIEVNMGDGYRQYY